MPLLRIVLAGATSALALITSPLLACDEEQTIVRSARVVCDERDAPADCGCSCPCCAQGACSAERNEVIFLGRPGGPSVPGAMRWRAAPTPPRAPSAPGTMRWRTAATPPMPGIPPQAAPRVQGHRTLGIPGAIDRLHLEHVDLDAIKAKVHEHLRRFAALDGSHEIELHFGGEAPAPRVRHRVIERHAAPQAEGCPRCDGSAAPAPRALPAPRAMPRRAARLPEGFQGQIVIIRDGDRQVITLGDDDLAFPAPAPDHGQDMDVEFEFHAAPDADGTYEAWTQQRDLSIDQQDDDESNAFFFETLPLAAPAARPAPSRSGDLEARLDAIQARLERLEALLSRTRNRLMHD